MMMSQLQLREVTMGLTDFDFNNAEIITELFRMRNKAEAVSAALSLTSFLSKALQGDKELIIRDKAGNMDKIIIPGLIE